MSAVGCMSAVGSRCLKRAEFSNFLILHQLRTSPRTATRNDTLTGAGAQLSTVMMSRIVARPPSTHWSGLQDLLQAACARPSIQNSISRVVCSKNLIQRWFQPTELLLRTCFGRRLLWFFCSEIIVKDWTVSSAHLM